jgi:uncharacterized protein YndB with AHSA1/START domain
MPISKITAEPVKQEIVITRVFDAPRELVWKAWTEPERMMRWWSPKGWTMPSCKLDVRVGGKYLFCHRTPEGEDVWVTGIYREIAPLERIVFTLCFADEHGNVVPASHYGVPASYYEKDADVPQEMLVTVTLEDRGGKTKVTAVQSGLPSRKFSAGATQGWNESFDKLAESLK